MSYLKNKGHILQLNVEKKKPRMLLSIVFYWLLSRWLLSDTILSMIIWLKGHNWEEGIEETISYYCENRRGYWHGEEEQRWSESYLENYKASVTVWNVWWLQMWLFSSKLHHLGWPNCYSPSLKGKMCTQDKLAGQWKAWCLYLNSSQSWAMQFGKEASVLNKHNKHTVYLLLQCFINIIYFGRGA